MVQDIEIERFQTEHANIILIMQPCILKAAAQRENIKASTKNRIRCKYAQYIPFRNYRFS
jgi:hypothetical protein